MPKFFDRVKFLVILIVSFMLTSTPQLAFAGGATLESFFNNGMFFLSGMCTMCGITMLFLTFLISQKNILKKVGRIMSSLIWIVLSLVHLQVPTYMGYLHLVIMIGMMLCFTTFLLCSPKEEDKSSEELSAN